MDNNKKTILLVEDDSIIAMLESNQLQTKGYNVIHEINGEKAIQTFIKKKLQIKIILMDIDLGKGIDGTKAAEEILKIQDVPIVFLSNHTEPEIVEKTEKITSYGYVVKNSGITVLDASIKMAFKLYESKMKEKDKEKTLKLQRDLGLKLSSTNSLNIILKYCLKAAINISGMDCGGIYLVNNSGDLNIIFHTGLPVAFLESASHYKANSPSAKIVMKGDPIYTNYEKLGVPIDKIRSKEGLRAVAIVPVPYENNIIASLNLGSHTMDEIPDYSKTVLENISTQIGSSILRAKIGEELKREKAFIDMALDAQADTFFLYEPGTGKAVRWNKSFREVSGYSDNEIAELPAPDSYYSPDDLKRAKLLIENVFNEGSGIIELELICKNKQKIRTEYRVSVIRDEQNIPKYLISIGRDITK